MRKWVNYSNDYNSASHWDHQEQMSGGLLDEFSFYINGVLGMNKRSRSNDVIDPYQSLNYEWMSSSTTGNIK